MSKFTFVELFAGIGGVSFGFEIVGGKCLMAAEFDPSARTQFAQISYSTLHPNVDLRGDVTKLDAKDVPDHDVLSFTTPCQSFSVAGKRGGFDDVRGTLYFEAMRIANEKKPKVIFMENVKGIVGHDGGKTLDTIVKVANECGYTVDFNVLNSKYFGVPQNRERFFMIGIRDNLTEPSDWVIEGNNVVAKGKRRINGYDDVKTFNFDWPAQEEVTVRLRDILESNVDEKYYLSEDKTAKLVAQLEASNPVVDESEPYMLGHVDLKGHDAIKRVYSPEGIAPTLTTMGGGHREPKIAEEETSAKKKERNTLKVLRELRGEVGEKEIAEWRLRILDTFQAPEILQSEMHGRSIHGTRADGRSELVHGTQTSKGNQEGGTVRDMRFYGESGRTPQGRELEEQLAREFTSFMSWLSYQDSPGEYLYHLRGTTQRSWLLQQALSKIQEIWGSDVHQNTRYRIRKLTPLETFRLQGFSDEAHQTLVDAGISNSQRYKQAGNAVTINVIEAIGEKLLPLLHSSNRSKA